MVKVISDIELSFGIDVVCIEEHRDSSGVFYMYRLRGDKKDRVYDPANPTQSILKLQPLTRKIETV